MATKDNNGGLLSRMARFVRNPTKDWSTFGQSELEPEPEVESGYSKQALKEMIERKRQNDFVRRREFDHLRKLRRSVPAGNPELAERPSAFPNSTGSNLEERATTLKKIDEIEAQMSRQWWKGKQGEATVGAGNPDTGSTPAFVTTLGSASSLTGAPAHDTVYEPTQMGWLAPSEATVAAPLLAPASPNSISAVLDAAAPATGFSSSKLFSLELGESLADPDLEEAAIRFANGDDAGAEAGLLSALQAEPVDPDSAAGWAAALFDLYRATGQQASFDRVAIDYAQRFGCSAPGWFSTPELLGHTALATPVAVAAPENRTVWQCPAELDGPAVQSLRASLALAPLPWHLDWSRLRTLAPDAGQPLASLFAEWCVLPVTLHFDGAQVLEKTLRNATPSGMRQIDPCWWRLRLDALRILRLPQEFELAALDYCVTYEVSPPSWEEVCCNCVVARDAAGTLSEQGPAPAAASVPESGPSNPAPAGQQIGCVPEVELCGEVRGDAAEVLERFRNRLNGADRLVVSCARLIRVDFSAAGSILNWVAEREAAGCHVQFHDVPRLVAAFFSVIGINQHARVLLRTT